MDMDPELSSAQITHMMTGDPGRFVALLRSKGFESPPAVWPIVIREAQLAAKGHGDSAATLRTLFDARLLETLSRMLIENRPTRMTIGTNNISSRACALMALGEIFRAARQPFASIPPADMNRQLDLPSILTVLLGEHDLWNQTETSYRTAVSQLIAFYMEGSNRWQDPCLLQVIRLLSKIWMFPGDDNQVLISATSLAVIFSQAPARSPVGLTPLMGFSLDQIFTRYTQIMAQKDLPPELRVANLCFFVKWPHIDDSNRLLDHLLRLSYLSQSVDYIVKLDRSGVIIPADTKSMFDKLQESIPEAWMDIMISNTALDPILQNIELEKCVKAGMVGWMVAFLIINQQGEDLLRRLGTCHMLKIFLTQTARRLPALRHRILEETNASLHNTKQDHNRPGIKHLVYLVILDIEIQALQDTGDRNGVNGECVAPECTRTRDATGLNLLSCSACYIAQYCSKECQKLDWKKHKRICKKQEARRND